MSAEFSWKKGGSGRLLELCGEQVVLSSTRPSPPGSTLEGTLVDPPGEVPSYLVKVRGCRKTGPECFRIEGRLTNLTREQRQAISRAPSPETNA